MAMTINHELHARFSFLQELKLRYRSLAHQVHNNATYSTFLQHKLYQTTDTNVAHQKGRLLLNADAHCNTKNPNRTSTPLHLAVALRDLETTNQLCRLEENIDKKDTNGNSPFSLATQDYQLQNNRLNLDIFLYLLHQKPDLNWQDNHKFCLMHRLALLTMQPMHQQEAIGLLAKTIALKNHGLYINKKDAWQRTPLDILLAAKEIMPPRCRFEDWQHQRLLEVVEDWQNETNDCI